MDPSRTSAHHSDMVIALGLISLMLVAVALWVAAGEPAVAALGHVIPDQGDEPSTWDVLGWHSYG